MDFLDINYENKETILQSFDRIADKISKDIMLVINRAHYRIVDFEFYFFSETKFKDPYTHKNKIQLESGKLYFHPSGIDITFGNGTYYGGILLRSVVKLFDGSDNKTGFMKYQTVGPRKVVTELFSNLNPLNIPNNSIEVIDIQGHNQDSCFYPANRILKTKRVNLKNKGEGESSYFENLEIRYITFVPYFKIKVQGIEKIVAEKVDSGKMSKEEAFEILNYNRVYK